MPGTSIKTKFQPTKLLKILDFPSHIVISIFVWPYCLFYHKNTRDPIQAIISSRDNATTRDEVNRWLKVRSKEAQYVVTGSLVIFAAMIASLSWVTLSGVHWSGPAIWYMGIVGALTAMVVGAQQTVVLPSDVDLDAASAVQQRLKRDGKARPRRDMLFVSQSPIMCFSLSVTCFLGGLSSVIISPLTQSPQWGPEAKTVLLYLTAMLGGVSVFVYTSFRVHHLWRQEP